MEQPRRREEEAIVLDFLQNGYSFDTRPMHLKTPIAQALGTDRFTLLELVPKKDVHLQPRATVYIGDQKREEIHHVNGKIPVDKLTATAQSELPHAIKTIVNANPKRFVDFYNNAQPLSIRTHSLELLPGVGKKHMQEILNAREEKTFESFEDIKARVKLITDPEKLIINRVLNEIKGLEKHNLFVAPPATEEDERGPRRFDGPRREGPQRSFAPRRF
jgi:putative nucleotide binding protein